MQFSYHQNIAAYFGAFVRKGDANEIDQLWVSASLGIANPLPQHGCIASSSTLGKGYLMFPDPFPQCGYICAAVKGRQHPD